MDLIGQGRSVTAAQALDLGLVDVLAEDPLVSGHVEIVTHHIGQPEQVVGKAGAYAAAGRLVPPVLHVPFDELVRRGIHDVGAGQVGA